MKKSFLLLAVALFSLQCLFARPVDPATARRAAQHFWRIFCSSDKDVPVLNDVSSLVSSDYLYVFVPDTGAGFVFVSADDVAYPILGYSASNPLGDSLHASVRYMLSCYEKEIALAQSLNAVADASTASLWHMLLSSDDRLALFCSESAKGAVEPLLTTQWDQGRFYNALCPADTNAPTGRTYVGCGATAMAQLLKYWNYPEVGTGSHSYYHNTYGLLSADFANTHYQWDSMPDQLSYSSSQGQIDAVATLSYHCGVAIDMNYGPSGSGAHMVDYGDASRPCAAQALMNYFGFKTSLQQAFRANFSDADWAQQVKSDLSASRPVCYAGWDEYNNGHFFIVDGYNGIDGYHVNWGWSGYCDGFYPLNAFRPRAGGAGSNPTGDYTHDQQALFKVEPALYLVTASVNDTLAGTVTGAGRYAYGATVSLTAIPNDGYRFVRWHDGLTMNPYTCSVLRDMSVTAFFEPLEGVHNPNEPVVRLFPNPVSDRLSVEADNLLSVDLFDALGNSLLHLDRTSVLDMSAYPAGTYLIRITTVSGTVCRSVVKK